MNFGDGNYGYPGNRGQNQPGIYQFPGSRSPTNVSVQDSLAQDMLGKRKQKV